MMDKERGISMLDHSMLTYSIFIHKINIYIHYALIHVYIHAYIYIHTFVHIHTDLSVRDPPLSQVHHMHTYIQTSTYMHTHINTNTHFYTPIHTFPSEILHSARSTKPAASLPVALHFRSYECLVCIYIYIYIMYLMG
jgi:hypothetical protein